MQYLTVKEYADLFGITRQAVEDRIKRKTLAAVIRPIPVKCRVIPVEDTLVESVKSKSLRAGK